MVYEARKVCDYDPRLSGVYSASMKGDCAERAGQRELVVVVVVANASPIAAVLGVNRGQGEYGVLARFDPATLSINTLSAAPLGSPPLRADAKLQGVLAIGDTTTLTGTLTEGACTYTIEASRPNGGKAGLLCSSDALCAYLAPAACTQLPPGVAGLRDIEGYVDSPLAPCPVPICKVTVAKTSACNPNEPILTAGCPTGNTVALGGVSTPAGTCFVPACVPNPACDALRPANATFSHTCEPTEFSVRGIAGCDFAVCTP